MRIGWKSVLCCAAVVWCGQPVAKAQVLLTLTPDTEVTMSGGIVDFPGTLLNTSSDVVFLNGDAINLAGPGFLIDDSPFLDNAPLFLTDNGSPDSTYSGLLFTVDTTTEPPGSYFGSFAITGGATGSSLDTVGSQIFEIDILPASSGVPEPKVYALAFGFGLAGAGFLRRRCAR
jgi:hypothetical protein